MKKVVDELVWLTIGSILICTGIGFLAGYPMIGFAIGCVLVIGVYALMRFIAWLFVEMVIGFFDSLTGNKTKR